MSMPVEVLWYPQARTDLLDIYVVIGIENPVAAERIYDALEMRAHQLSQHPRLGPRRPDIQTSTRVLVEGPYLILYETRPDTDEGTVTEVAIVRVIDGRRDLARI
ncbi:toxin ParE1/3/4 [Azospirillum sp. RU38E]|jgi:toxin ParE1/3/4|nr:toxin ParE1/3/4 [Azospirillum sp. RU38E]SNT35771.1 toxin ParE1/3/4 [Azospirillum sp. RU37A]